MPILVWCVRVWLQFDDLDEGYDDDDDDDDDGNSERRCSTGSLWSQHDVSFILQTYTLVIYTKRILRVPLLTSLLVEQA